MTELDLILLAHQWADVAAERAVWEEAGLPADVERALQWCIFYIWASEP